MNGIVKGVDDIGVPVFDVFKIFRNGLSGYCKLVSVNLVA